MSEWISAEACPKCGSSNNLRRHADGHAHCFTPGCTYREATVGGSVAVVREQDRQRGVASLVHGECEALPKRGIALETCEKWGYQVGERGGERVHIANFRDEKGQVVGQKIRSAGKKFSMTGDTKVLGSMLYGQWLWRDGGKMVVVTEGEIDALSVSQVQGNKWPVVSIPNGAQGATKSIKAQLEWLEKFEKVVLMFDMDEPGRTAVFEVAQILAPGRAYIASLPLKDANEMLKAHREKELVDAIWSAKAYRPDGIVDMADLWDDVSKPVAGGLDYPYPGMNELLHGARAGELVTITAGTGIGKSAFCAEIAYHLAFVHGEKVGYIALEENVARTARRFLGINLDRPIHLPGVVVEPETMKRAFAQTLGTGRLVAYDHFGSLDPEILLGRIRYMVKSLGCKFVFLDHLSIVVSGLQIDDERKAIDVAMTQLRSLVEETGAGIFVVSHLRRVSGSGAHEEGHEVSLSHLRGSQAIAQLSDAVVALERDQQADDQEERNTTVVRVLKNRLSGETGKAGDLHYDTTTGRLLSGPTFNEATL